MMEVSEAGYNTSESDEDRIPDLHSNLQADLESLLLLKSGTHIALIINHWSNSDRCLACHTYHAHREIASRRV